MPQSPPPDDYPSDADWELVRRALNTSYSHNFMNAADLTQETLARMWKWLQDGHKVEGKDGLLKLAYGFARHIRSEQGRTDARRPLDLPADVPAEFNRTRGLSTFEASLMLEELLAQLTEPERWLILAAESMSQEAVARQLNVPLATMRVLLHRARAKLKKLAQSSSKSEGNV